MTATHEYHTRLAWQGSTGVGYDAYDRTHTMTLPPSDAALTLSGDPAFKGDARYANPEQLLLAAASSCQMLSFLAVAARARIDVIAYEDDAHAVMPETQKPMRITLITLRPVITVAGDVDDDRIARLVRRAHETCFIANTLSAEMVIEPNFCHIG